VLVVLHDPTLERTTDGRGPVDRHTLAQLQALDAGARFTSDQGRSFPWRGRGATIPSFDEVIESLPRELNLLIELKTPAATALVATAIRRHAIAHRVVVASDDDATTRPLWGAGIALGAGTGDVARLLLPALLRRRIAPRHYRALCIPPQWHGLPLPIAALARAVRASGTVTHVWTINDPDRALQLWRAGVQGIISDDPGAMLAARPPAPAAPRPRA
jgi:glycerophosphoryl diester phosphodiesterase